MVTEIEYLVTEVEYRDVVGAMRRCLKDVSRWGLEHLELHFFMDRFLADQPGFSEARAQADRPIGQKLDFGHRLDDLRPTLDIGEGAKNPLNWCVDLDLDDDWLHCHIIFDASVRCLPQTGGNPWSSTVTRLLYGVYDAAMAVLGHGIDCVEVDRIQVLLDTHGERFTRRCFTNEERTHADQADRRRAERYAVRFACKEAVLKALGTGLVSGMLWTDIGVQRAVSGAPSVELHGRCLEIAQERGISKWLVSLSHTPMYAVASAIATSDQ